MFFTEWGTAPPKLERALLDGTERTDIVNKNIVYPYGVAVDHPNRLVKLFPSLNQRTDFTHNPDLRLPRTLPALILFYLLLF